MTSREPTNRAGHSSSTNAWSWIDQRLAETERQQLLRRIRQRRGGQSARIEFDGRDVLNFASNDYLSIAGESRVTEAVAAAVRQAGWGSGASPLVAGFGQAHHALQTALAEFENVEAALLLPTGYAANVAAITALADSSTVIFSDAKNHASIIDGCRLAAGCTEVYAHANVKDLATRMARHKTAPRKLIVTDGLFSMDGDLAPVPPLVDLAEQFGAMLLVDEAHATGVFGDTGKGVCESYGLSDAECLLRVGTLSKALGSFGGFVAGPQRVIEWLTNAARTLIFSTAAPEAVCAAGLAALEIVRTEPERRIGLLRSAARMRANLRERGFDVGGSTSQIIPVVLGDAERTMQVADALWQAGYFVPGIRPPSVPNGESLLRISLRSDHTEEMLDGLVDKIAELA